MKPFNLEQAKAGHPVCTRNGKDVKILCFDRKSENYPIVALVKYVGQSEDLLTYTNNGYLSPYGYDSMLDLMMKSTKKEGWINIYQNENNTWTSCNIFSTKDEAVKYAYDNKKNFLESIKIEWEE